MEARDVWHLWRRVLREEPLQEAVFAGRLAEQAESLHLGAAECEIAEEYGRNPAGTRFFITNYRFRMVSSFVNALETAAPLTHRLLRRHSVDVDALATRFLDSVEWLDFGPYVYTYGGKVLSYLLDQPDLSALHGLPELVSIEQAGVRITVDAANEPEQRSIEAGAYVAIGPVATVQSPLDVSAWLRSASAVGREPAPPRLTWYLVYLRPPQLMRRIVAVPPLAVDILNALRTPQSLAQLSAQFDEKHPHWGADHETALLSRLVSLGVVVPPARTG